MKKTTHFHHTLHTVIPLWIVCILCLVSPLLLAGCGSQDSKEGGEVIVYNWGEYIDPETIDRFEEETGIKVIYDEFETNEIMYPVIEAGAISYDLVCPSDYMIQKMIKTTAIIITATAAAITTETATQQQLQKQQQQQKAWFKMISLGLLLALSPWENQKRWPDLRSHLTG